MKNDYKKILSFLKYLGIQIDIPSNNFATRILIQKIVYIFKHLGLQFSNYDDYNFYIKGIYSLKLSSDYYNFHSECEILPNTTPLNSEIEELNQYNKYIQKNRLFTTNIIEFHEALTTLIYLKQVNPNLDEKQLKETAKILKPHLTKRILTISLNVVKQIEFKDKLLTPEIQSEFDLWDSLND